MDLRYYKVKLRNEQVSSDESFNRKIDSIRNQIIKRRDSTDSNVDYACICTAKESIEKKLFRKAKVIPSRYFIHVYLRPKTIKNVNHISCYITDYFDTYEEAKEVFDALFEIKPESDSNVYLIKNTMFEYVVEFESNNNILLARDNITDNMYIVVKNGETITSVSPYFDNNGKVFTFRKWKAKNLR